MRISNAGLNIQFCGFLSLAIAAAFISSILFPQQAGAQNAPRAAIVSRTAPVPDADLPIVQHLRDRGWSISVFDDDRIKDSGRRVVSGFDLVVVTSTVVRNKILWRLRAAPEPIIVMKKGLYHPFRMTDDGASDSGFTTASRKVNVVKPGSVMAAGLNGEVFVATKAKPMNFGKVGPDAEIIATARGTTNIPVMFAYDAGDRLFDGYRAAGKRIGFHMTTPRFANRDAWALFDGAALWATPKAPEVDNEPLEFNPIARANAALLGANVSGDDFPNRFEAVAAFERQTGRKLDVINRFHEFSAGLQASFFWDRLHIEAGRTVMISWRATDNGGSVNGEPDPRRASRIVTGEFDEQIIAMAVSLRDLEAPVLLRFNWEMDQDRGDPQYIGTPQEFIAAWRYVHRIFEQRGAKNVEWVWAPRARSFAKDVGPLYYPGFEYVDWIGGSAVPINSFTDAQTIYSAWNQWATNVGKPQLLWLGLRENPADATWKADFLDELRFLASTQWTNIKALVYYSSNSPLGFDYTTDTSFRSLTAFRNLACDQRFTRFNSC
jgi:hypothetical protein